jgi:hypothetical protein
MGGAFGRAESSASRSPHNFCTGCAIVLKTKFTAIPERYKSKLTEHIFKSPDYSLKEKGAQMVRGRDGKFQNPLKPKDEPVQE